MNFSSVLSSNHCLHLTITLAHFLWQGTLIALLTLIASLLLRRKSSSLRYTAFLPLFLLMAICPIVTFVYINRTEPISSQRNATVRERVLLLSPPPTTRERPFDLPQVQHPLPKMTSQLSELKQPWNWSRVSPYATAAYLAGVLVMFARLLVGLYGGQTLRRRSEPVDDPAILRALAHQAKRLRLTFTPAIAFCREVMVPTVVGVLRPMILLPISLASGLSPEQVEVLIAHELAHLRRYDHLVNILQRILEAFLFFHPATWYVSRLIRVEREHCCDDLVVAVGGKPTLYAASLVQIAELCLANRSALRGNVAALGAAETSSHLKHRILRLLDSPTHEQVRLNRTWTVIFGAAILVSITVFVSSASSKTNTPISSKKTNSALSKPQQLVRIPNGLAVQLVDVKPDHDHEDHRPQESWWTFTVHLEGKIGQEADGVWRILVKRPTKNEQIFQDRFPWNTKDTRTLKVNLGSRPDSVDLVYGVAQGPWKPAAFIGPDGATGLTFGDHKETIISAASQNGQWTCVDISHNFIDYELRLRILDKKQKEHLPVQVTMQYHNIHRTRVFFDSVPVNQIDKMYVDYRPFQWAEFKNVALEPKSQPISETKTATPSSHSNKQLLQISAKMTILSVPTKADLSVIEKTGRLSGTNPLSRLVSQEEADEFLAQIKKINGAQVICAPQILTLEHQTGLIRTGQEIPLSLPITNQPAIKKTFRCPVGTEVSFQAGTIPTGGTKVDLTCSQTSLTGNNLAPQFIEMSSVVAADIPAGKLVLVQIPAKAKKIRLVSAQDHLDPATKANTTDFKKETIEENVDTKDTILVLVKPTVIPKPAPEKPTTQPAPTSASTISGIVKFPDGKPAAGVRVYCTRPKFPFLDFTEDFRPRNEGFHYLDTTTESDGKFSFPREPMNYSPSFPDGRQIVAVGDHGFGQVAEKDLTANPVITLQPFGRIEGTVPVDIVPGKRQKVSIMHQQTVVIINGMIPVDDQGHFVANRIVPGKNDVNRVYCDADDRILTVGCSQFVDVKSGQTTKIKLGFIGRPVVGKLISPATLKKIDDTCFVGALYLRKVEPPYPPGLTPEQKTAWYNHWIKDTREGKVYWLGDRKCGLYIQPDGVFRVEDTESGNYRLEIKAYARSELSSDKPLGEVSLEFQVPPIPNGRSQEPLNIGQVQLKIDPAFSDMGKSYQVTLPSGMKIELLGVNRYPGQRDTAWWQPDGYYQGRRPFETIPKGFIPLGFRDIPKDNAFEFVISHEGNDDVDYQWSVANAQSYAGPLSVKDRNGEIIRNIKCLGVANSERHDKTDLTLYVAGGKWETLLDNVSPTQNVSRPWKGGILAVLTPVADHNETVARLMYPNNPTLIQVQAMDSNQKWHSSYYVYDLVVGDGPDKETIHQYRIKIPLKDVVKFRLRTSIREVVTFRNVSLVLGKRTDVRTVIPLSSEPQKTE